MGTSELNHCKLVMTLLARNEADIIRENIEFHLGHGVDFIIATDNGSTDRTREILASYEKQGVLHLIDEPGRDHRQSQWVNRMAEIAVEQYRADVVFHCDADEFWYPRSGSLKDDMLSSDADILTVDVVNVVLAWREGQERFPDDACYAVVRPFETGNIERDSRGRNLYLFRYPHKIMFRSREKLFLVCKGNHGVINADVTTKEVRSEDIRIYHYPVRGREQFLRKVMQGGVACLRRKDAHPSESRHLKYWYESIAQGAFDREYRLVTFDRETAASLFQQGVIADHDFRAFIRGAATGTLRKEAALGPCALGHEGGRGPSALSKEREPAPESAAQQLPYPLFFPESALAHTYCKGSGLEIGGAAHNPFGLDVLNVDLTDSSDTAFKRDEIKLCGTALKVDIVAKGDNIPLPDASQDFIVSSHVLEHFPNPIKALLEWDRLVRPGGIIFMIVPHKERTFDRERERTSLDHLIEDFLGNRRELHEPPGQHEHVWITEDVVEVIRWIMSNLPVAWKIEEIHDVDDKVGNGFTIVIRKLPLVKTGREDVRKTKESMPEKLLRIVRQEGVAGIVRRMQDRGYLPRSRFSPYVSWIRRSEPSAHELELQKKRSLCFSLSPKISIIMPVYNSEPQWLRRAVESVLAQTYPHWELCIADGGSTARGIRPILEDYARKDPRIRLKYLDANLGISGNSNAALSLASGEFAGFLDHDDELAPFALYEIVTSLQEDPQTDFLYSDEDKITSRGRRFDPVFKPGWSPEFLLSCNYITHFSVLRRSLIEKIGGFRSRFDGSQDYDLFLRAAEATDRIRHVPRVLYHWRMHRESASSSPAAKGYAYDAAVDAIQDALTRRNEPWKTVEKITPGYYRVRYHLPEPHPHVSVVLLCRDGRFPEAGLHAIADRTSYPNYSLQLVSDGGRLEGLPVMFGRTGDKAAVTRGGNCGSLPASLNAASRSSQAGYIVFLDERIGILAHDWLDTMLEALHARGVGVVGGKVLTADGQVRHAGYLLGVGGLAGYSHRTHRRDSAGYSNRLRVNQNLSAVPADCMVIRSDVFHGAGGFDEGFVDSLFDVDLCMRIRESGMRIVMTPFAEFLWTETAEDPQSSPEAGMNPLQADLERFLRKWPEAQKAVDPYYNPNLTLEREDFSIRC